MNFNLLDQKRKAKQPLLEKKAHHIKLLNNHPRLDWLFFELTNACNLECRHCASSCSPKNADFLKISEIQRVLDSAQKAYSNNFTVALTGGEPMIHPQFFKIIEMLSNRGLVWGMTSNASLIGKKEAELLQKYHMGSISVSLDGLEETHDYFRRSTGNFRKTIEGLTNLTEILTILQVTTVVHKKNLSEIPEIFRLLQDLKIKSWRLAMLDPVGRGAESNELVPSPDEVWEILEYVRQKRISGSDPEIVLGCPHYFSYPYEREVRDEVFQCMSGKTVASVTATGDYIGCLDAPRIPELVQGNLAKNDFSTVWEQQYKIYRSDYYMLNEECSKCSENSYCRGDAMHTWEFNENRPLVCYKQNFNKV